MSSKNSPSSFVVGLALFSMFFGSGNLIFPLFLGTKYQGYFYIAALGFIITAVLLPTLGILAMIPAQGHYLKLFDGLVSHRLARWFLLVVLVFWIPLGSGPRCVVLAHSSLMTHSNLPLPVWLFSLLFLLVVYFFIHKRSHIINNLGRILTPLLLISIALIVGYSFSKGELGIPLEEREAVFFQSIIEGYYTQDLIAAIFFSSVIVAMLRQGSHEPTRALKKTLEGGLIAISMLAIIYTALMCASALHSDLLMGLSGDKLVSTLGIIALGPHLGAVSSLAVSLACLTTEVALVLVFADFLSSHFLHGLHYKKTLFCTLAMVWITSLLTFEGVMNIIAPAMQIIYPLLFALCLRYLWKNWRWYRVEE